MTLTLLRHSLMMMLRNLIALLQVCAVPLLAGMLGSLLIGAASAGGTSLLSRLGAGAGLTSAFSVVGMLTSLLNLVVLAWIGVNWNRFVLREEPPRWLPRFDGTLIVAYIIPLFLIWLTLTLFTMFFGMFVQPMLFVVIGGLPTFVLSYLGVTWFGFWITLRFGLAMPAAAVGRPLPVTESWSDTQRLGRNIALIALILVLAQEVINWFMPPGLVGEIGLIVWAQFIKLLVMALVTALYGNLIERRRF